MKKLSYADIAKILAKKEGKYEKLKESSSRFSKNTAKRMLPRIKKAEEELMELQELHKISTTSNEAPDDKKFADGGAVTKMILNNGMDALSRILASSNMHNPIESNYLSRIHLDKNINTSNQINSIDRNAAIANEYADRGLSDSRVATAFKTKNMIDSALNKAQIYQNTSMAENQLSNQEKQINSNIDAQNNSLNYNYNNSVNDFKNARIASFANSVNNAFTNIRKGMNDIYQNDMDKFKYQLILNMFKNTGVLDRLLAPVKDSPAFVKSNS